MDAPATSYRQKDHIVKKRDRQIILIQILWASWGLKPDLIMIR